MKQILYLFLITLFILSSCQKEDDTTAAYVKVYGCTDVSAENYNEAANVYVPDICCYTFGCESGCTDEAFCNYDPSHTVNDGSCWGLPGCTNPVATNYNALADCDNGSCIYPVTPGCTDPMAYNFNLTATIDDGSCCYVAGCTDPAANNYHPSACYDDDSCEYTFWECDGVGSCYSTSSFTGYTTYQDCMNWCAK